MDMTTPSAAEQPARVCARLLIQLHALIARGEGDSDAAEALRDQMDAPWSALTEQERERLTYFSEDLTLGMTVRDSWDS